MSNPGKGDEGFVMIDVLVTLVIITIGFVSLFGLMNSAMDSTEKREESLLASIEERNK